EVRKQLEQQRRLVADLTATGRAYLAHRPVTAIPLTAHEKIEVRDPVKRLRLLSVLTSNVALNAARSIASSADQNSRQLTRIRLEEELTRQAFHDGLTDLPNRALFRDRLDQALARCERSREPLAVLLVDLDGFKQVNDSLGHDAGDRLLQDVAVRFGAVIRP